MSHTRGTRRECDGGVADGVSSGRAGGRGEEQGEEGERGVKERGGKGEVVVERSWNLCDVTHLYVSWLIRM